jgi:DNA-binding transcriptional LysR family regulator
VSIELLDLRWAIAASQHRSLRRAAEALNVRQSTLSRRLLNMEENVGAQLFERSNGGTRPTLAGLEFINASRQILTGIEAAIGKLRAQSRGELGRLTIGVYASLATGNLHATLTDYHRRLPEIEVHTLDGGHDRLLCALTSNMVDVAIMTPPALSWDDRTLPLWSERVIIAIPESHRLVAQKAVSWSELFHETILLPQQGPGAELERLLISKQPSVGPKHIVRQESSLDRLLSLVSAEYGILLMLEGATGIRFDGVVYRELLEDQGVTRFNFAAYWRECNENPSLRPFLALLLERYPDLSSSSG